jgi:putative peptidoglycan lipid II flippase
LRGFFALHDTKTPFVVSLAAFFANTVLSVVFVFYMGLGVPGLALAFSLANILQLVGLWLALRMRIGGMQDWPVVVSISKMIIASLAMVPFIQEVKTLVAAYLTTETFVAVLTQGVVAAGTGLAVYAVTSYLLRSNELMVLVNAFKRRLGIAAPDVDLSAGREV